MAQNSRTKHAPKLAIGCVLSVTINLANWVIFDVLASNPMRTVLVVASMLAVALLLLLPLGYHAVWDGSFDLTIEISTDQTINESSLLFATCWHETEALDAVENSSVYDYGFRTARTSATGQFSIDVPCSGRDNAYGLGSTYNHPLFLVIEYRRSDNSEQLVRKLLGIPTGQGPRTMTVELP